MAQEKIYTSQPSTWREWISSAGLPILNHLETCEPWEPTNEDRNAAWLLYVELSTRISTAKLQYREGNEIAALDSLYNVFLEARRLVAQYGRTATYFATPTNVVFEELVRPFTGYWHGQKELGALAHQDKRREFRRRLIALQVKLGRFCRLLEPLTGSATRLSGRDSQSVPNFNDGELKPAEYLGAVPAPAQMALELSQIVQRRQNAYDDPQLQSHGGLGTGVDNGSLGCVGLSLSGGGIRSATFCLGVVQSLVRHGVFQDIDYLSTVSGGGYLGGFLSAALSPLPAPAISAEELLTTPSGRTGDSEHVRWLRNRSKYLIGNNKKERRESRNKLLQVLIPGGPTLHDYYRDKLAETYLGTTDKIFVTQLKAANSSAPYLIINMAVNLPGSDDIELRGRNSDFFSVTPHFVGSVTTGYCATEEMEQADPRFDLATAIATSGAALSPHMGMRTKRPVAALMAAANVRLGFWAPNPQALANGRSPGAISALRSRWREFRGTLSENENHVNLSDGGFVENLGLYELIRRRCKFIVAVDGECDEGRTCGALIKASRLASIDFGVHIDIDYSELSIDDEGLSQAHFAFGRIDYGRNEIGYLLYIKSSMTGNEPSYVNEYRRDHPTFPHETTADQLFDENQFEAYRALGEHAANDVFSGEFIDKNKLLGEQFKTRAWLTSLVRELL